MKPNNNAEVIYLILTALNVTSAGLLIKTAGESIENNQNYKILLLATSVLSLLALLTDKKDCTSALGTYLTAINTLCAAISIKSENIYNYPIPPYLINTSAAFLLTYTAAAVCCALKTCSTGNEGKAGKAGPAQPFIQKQPSTGR